MGGAPTLRGELRRAVRVRHYSRRTEEAYDGWVRRFVRFCGLRHPRELGAAEVAAFLSHLAERERLSAATQNQAASVYYELGVTGRTSWLLENKACHSTSSVFSPYWQPSCF